MHGGINNFSNVLGNNGSQLLKNLQSLIAANPSYLTSGIPTHLIQQMWMSEPAAKVTPKIQNVDVCFYFIFCFTVKIHLNRKKM
jgi:hypothetical protein